MITKVTNPRWSTDHQAILLDVELNSTENAVYVARGTDCEVEGVRLYYKALLEEFGPIADSDEERILRGEFPPPEGCMIVNGQIVDVALAEQQATEELSRRLAELSTEEAKAMAEINEDYAIQRKAKIAALLAVKQQEDWPVSVVWPE
jgi:hypothetical protein